MGAKVRSLGSGPVRRIRARWQKGSLTIESEVRVPRMTLPASIVLPALPRGVLPLGAWYDVVGAKGDLIYRQSLSAQMRAGIEVPQSDGSFVIVAADAPPLVELLVPDLPSCASLRVYAPTSTPGAADRTRRIAVLDLRARPSGRAPATCRSRKSAKPAAKPSTRKRARRPRR